MKFYGVVLNEVRHHFVFWVMKYVHHYSIHKVIYFCTNKYGTRHWNLGWQSTSNWSLYQSVFLGTGELKVQHVLIDYQQLLYNVLLRYYVKNIMPFYYESSGARQLQLIKQKKSLSFSEDKNPTHGLRTIFCVLIFC